MNEKYALGRINEFIFCIQKFRSNVEEGLSKAQSDLLPGLYPWIFGAKCPLDVLLRVSGRETVTKNEYYNFMIILHRFMPTVLLVAALNSLELKNTNADTSILLEWEESPTQALCI